MTLLAMSDPQSSNMRHIWTWWRRHLWFLQSFSSWNFEQIKNGAATDLRLQKLWYWPRLLLGVRLQHFF